MSWTPCRDFLLPGLVVSPNEIQFAPLAATPSPRLSFMIKERRVNIRDWTFFVANFSPNSHRHKTPSWLGYLIKFYIVELLRAGKTCLMCCHFSISTLHVNNATRFTDSRVVFIAAQRALALCGRCSGADGTLARRFSILMTLLIKNSMPKLVGIPSQKINKPPLVLAPERPLSTVSLAGCFKEATNETCNFGSEAICAVIRIRASSLQPACPRGTSLTSESVERRMKLFDLQFVIL